MRRRRIVIGVALALMLSDHVDADPYVPTPGELLHLKTPSTAKTDGGTDLRLPPGYFRDEPSHVKYDLELRRLQEAEVRLAAENKSLRKSAQGISFGWYALAGALVTGFAAGVYAAK